MATLPVTFTPAEHRLFSRFTEYQFDNDPVFVQGKTAVEQRTRKKWKEDKEAKNNKAKGKSVAETQEEEGTVQEFGREGNGGEMETVKRGIDFETETEQDPPELLKLIQVEIMGSKVFYFGK
ncbi:hypothetical protein HDU93_001991 [Gonapodya sp. JEL0774]|nr:hypothetical protein HDU93_001991 [Gonapodya sp. JEL0774]